MMRILSFFKSVKLAVALILILAASSVIGTLIPQGRPSMYWVEKHGEGTYRVLQFLGFLDLYHSGWFVCLILLLAVNILVCSLSRVRRTYRLTVWGDREDSREPPAGLSIRRTVTLPEPPDVVREKLANGLSGLKFRVGPGAGDLRLDRGRLGRWGPEFTHLGFLVIIAGMVIGSISGFRGTLDLPEGETASTIMLRSGKDMTLPFEIRCDEFEATYFSESARPKEYTSWLTVIEAGKDLPQKVVEVNHPLKHRGYWFYQSTFGELGPEPGNEWIELVIHPEDVRVELVPGERKPIEGSGDEVELLRFEPDFVMDANREVTSRSQELRNPAAQIRLYRDGTPLIRQWVFSKFPNVHVPEDVAHMFRLARFASREFTGLQVTYDPGVPVVWTGCGLLILGLFLSFLVSHRRIWVRVEAEGTGSVLRIAAGARRGRGQMEGSINRLLQEVSAPGRATEDSDS